MKTLSRILIAGFTSVAAITLADSPKASGQFKGVPPIPTGSTSASTQTSPEMKAKQQEIWQSREMIEARAWLEDHFRRSAQISDAQGKQYLASLESLPPDQMQIWLINFQREHNRQVQEGKSFREANRAKMELRNSSPQVGGFRNPYAGQGRNSAGFASANMRQSIGTQPSAIAPRPTVQKPFSDPSYQRSIRPLVTSEDAARFEILRGLGPWRGF